MGRFDPTMHKRLAILVASDLALGIFAPNEVKAQQASASSIQQDGAASGGGESGGKDDTGQDFTNPQNLFQLRYQYRTAPGTMATILASLVIQQRRTSATCNSGRC